MTDETKERERKAGLIMENLTLDGGPFNAQLAHCITACDLSRTNDGAPTLDFRIRDKNRAILRSGILDNRITVQFDKRSFELAKVGKQGDEVTATFEDLVVAELRRHTTPRKVAKGTMSRLDFARLLLSETPWIPLFVNTDVAKSVTAKVELARGNPDQKEAAEDPEDTWTCLKRIFNEVGWRCYVDFNAPTQTTGIQVGPDAAYTSGGTVITLREFGPGVDYINFDFDIGKPIATATADVRGTRWQLPPGTPVTVADLGTADGVWIVSQDRSSLFSVNHQLTLKRPEPELPEPEPPAEPTGSQQDEGTGQPNAGGPQGWFVMTGRFHFDIKKFLKSKAITGPAELAAHLFGLGGGGGGGLAGGNFGPDTGQFQMPCRGSFGSPFGPRGGRLHAGVDIVAPTGTPIGASRGGVVSFAGSQSGYGNVVYIQHPGGAETRYGHMSRIGCRRGQPVSAGTFIGAVGSTGRSTGPHLHFEIRIGGRPVNPRLLIR